jgi:tetratricopeptide (TPR) repeat protein
MRARRTSSVLLVALVVGSPIVRTQGLSPAPAVSRGFHPPDFGATLAGAPGSTVDMAALERAIAADPENLKIAADYRQLAIAAGDFDRPIDFLEKLAKRGDSGPNVQISLALACIDKVPTSGDVRRLYLGRDAINALTKAIDRQPTVLAYYIRGLVNLYYNNFIYHRTPRGVADLTRALSMITKETPPPVTVHVYIALGDGEFRLGDVAQARATWSTGAALFPDNAALKTRLNSDAVALARVVTSALTASRRVDTSLDGALPVH